MLWSCEYVDETPKHQLQSILSVVWWKIWNGWLRADYELQIRDEVNNERPMLVQRLLKTVTPTLELCLASTQQPMDKALKSLQQWGIGNVTLVLVEFARCKKPMSWN